MLWGICSDIYGEVNVSVEKCVEIKGRLCWKIAKLFYFCHLKKLVRPETFGPHYVYVAQSLPLRLVSLWAYSYNISAQVNNRIHALCALELDSAIKVTKQGVQAISITNMTCERKLLHPKLTYQGDSSIKRSYSTPYRLHNCQTERSQN